MPKRSPGIERRVGVRGVTWRVRVQHGRRQISKSFKTLREAEAWRASMRTGAALPGSREPFGDYLTHWLETHDMAPNSRSRYGQVIRWRVLPIIGSVELGKLTGRHVQDVYNAARGSSEAGQLTAIINGALRLAVREGLINRNVAEGLSVPRGEQPEDGHEPNVWTPADVRTFLAGVRDHHLYLIFFRPRCSRWDAGRKPSLYAAQRWHRGVWWGSGSDIFQTTSRRRVLASERQEAYRRDVPLPIAVLSRLLYCLLFPSGENVWIDEAASVAMGQPRISPP